MTSRPAGATRAVLAGGSIVATFGMVVAMILTGPQPAVTPAATQLRVVVTDPRIDTTSAVAAARAAAASGETVAYVPVAAAPEPAPPGASDAAHTTTRSS